MTDPFSKRPERKSRAMRGTLQHSRGPSPQVVIGLAHVATGALGVFSALSQGLFAANGIALLPGLAIAVAGLCQDYSCWEGFGSRTVDGVAPRSP